MVAPGNPATRGCGGRGSWPFRRMGSLGGSCPSTRQQIPPGWQDGTSHSVYWGGPEGRDGVSGRGDVGEDRARHSSQNGELAAQGRPAWTAMEEGPGPHREGQGPSGCGGRLHLSCIAVEVGEKANPDRVCMAAGSFQDPQVPDDLGETFPKTNAPEVNSQGSGIEEPCK